MKPHFIFWYTKKMRKRIVIQTYICIWIVAMKLLNLRIIKRPLKHKFIGCLKEYKALFGPVLETKKHQIIHPILEPHKDSNIWNHRIFWFLILRLMGQKCFQYILLYFRHWLKFTVTITKATKFFHLFHSYQMQF